jgi:predicted DNA-binding transcriptional regulator YafY
MRLYNTIKQIILEKSNEEIANSVRNRNLVTIYYDGEDNGGKGLRTIEPFCFGVSKAGNNVIRAWEREGASYTAQKGEQPLPGWRLFRVDRIGSYNVNPTQKFEELRPSYNPNDKGMTSINICAKFDLENTEEV